MIGIFDSGLGGLTALKELHQLAPHEKLIYFGDTGRVPYGTRSADTIKRYAMQDTRFLLSKGVDAILVACGTVSTTALVELQESFAVPIIGVVEPAAKAAVKATKNGKIAVIGTSATIRTNAFPEAIRRLDPGLGVISRACPLFVPLVENGFVSPDCEITRLTCLHYLRDIIESGADTLILGCTHYPIIADCIASTLPGVTLINTGKEAARQAAALCPPGNGNFPCTKESDIRYYVSDDPAMFTASGSLFLGKSICGKVEKADIENY